MRNFFIICIFHNHLTLFRTWKMFWVRCAWIKKKNVENFEFKKTKKSLKKKTVDNFCLLKIWIDLWNVWLIGFACCLFKMKHFWFRWVNQPYHFVTTPPPPWIVVTQCFINIKSTLRLANFATMHLLSTIIDDNHSLVKCTNMYNKNMRFCSYNSLSN